jgi:hypothetical protein
MSNLQHHPLAVLADSIQPTQLGGPHGEYQYKDPAIQKDIHYLSLGGCYAGKHKTGHVTPAPVPACGGTHQSIAKNFN